LAAKEDNQMRRYLLLTLCSFLLVVPVIGGQEKGPEPSLSETTNWLKSTLSLHGVVARKSDHAITKTTSTVEFDDCLISATKVVTTTIGDYSPITLSTQEIKFSLGDITSASVDEDASSGSGKKVHLVLSKPGRMLARPSSNASPLSVDNLDLHCDEKEIAERITKALLHAAALCAKKKEPF
jgi:hypothetical protein